MKIILGVLLFLGVNIYADINTTKKAMIEYQKGNIDKAVKLLSKSCDSGEHNACVNLGYIYVRGLSVKKNLSRGYSLLKKACNAKNDKGCIVLGNSIIEEEGNLWYNFQKSKTPTPKDQKEHMKRRSIGVGYLNKACEDGSSAGCNNLGGSYWNYIQQNGGIKKFPKMADKAFGALGKACDLKSLRSCMQLGYIYENMNKQNFVLASKYYKKACDLGYKKACDKYKRLHASGY
ncbi:MAG: tetratricopeptide repeat protein [Sulfurospirillum sp.]